MHLWKCILYSFAFPVLCISVQITLAQDVCTCKEKKPPSRFYRYSQKHETHFDNFSLAQDTLTPADMIKWQKTYKNIGTILKTRPLDQPRVQGTPEESLYVLKGYMWFIKHEKHGESADCDFHIEIGPRNKKGRRVIVEMTNNNCNLQQQILDHIKAQGCKLNEEFSQGIACVVAGIGFYDRVHGPANHGRKGKTTFTSWELHPVRSIAF